MPLQNRVAPDGSLIATPARGGLMGNRGGRIHDPQSRELGNRRWTSRRWIHCSLSFRERQRNVWGGGYTELFFLDGVTSLAAGHRPCFECRRAEAKDFADALGRSLELDRPPGASEIDRLLHAERLDGREKRLHQRELSGLPDGAMVLYEGAAYAVAGDRLLRWSPGGYLEATSRPAHLEVLALSPPTTIRALAAGFEPCWHPSRTGAF